MHEDEIKAKIVFDMVYDPAETRFLALAKARGAQTIAGIEMFVHQGARQFEIWTGKPAPWDEMLRAATLTLQQRAAARWKSLKTNNLHRASDSRLLRLGRNVSISSTLP